MEAVEENLIPQQPPIDDDDEEHDLYVQAKLHFWFNIEQDYAAFAKIANVRNDHGLLEVRYPRGLPTVLSASSISEEFLRRSL
jgi:hypothetical protein